MSDTEPIVWFRQRDTGAPPEIYEASTVAAAPRVAFDRKELNLILTVYGAKVAQGEWRDYALDFTPEAASFCIYRRTSEMPLYRVVKTPRLARKQGQYAVIAQGGHVLKRGPDLAQILRVFTGKLRLVSV